MILRGIEYQRPTSLNMRILADHVTYSFLAFMKSIFHFCLGCYCGGYSQNGRSNLSSYHIKNWHCRKFEVNMLKRVGIWVASYIHKIIFTYPMFIFSNQIDWLYFNYVNKVVLLCSLETHCNNVLSDSVTSWCPDAIVHDDVIKWKHFPRNWPFVRGIHRSQVNSPHKGQWRGALVFFHLRLNKRLSKQSWGWWFETVSRPLWRHCNVQKPAFWSCFTSVYLCYMLISFL